MRPGPGLVMITLALISGARRGSTSQVSTTTTTTTTSVPVTATYTAKQYQQLINQQYIQHQKTKENFDDHKLPSEDILPNLFLNNLNYHYTNNINNPNYINYYNLGKIDHDKNEHYNSEEGTGALARVNPWLSACDLTQSSQVPDLQVQIYSNNEPRYSVGHQTLTGQCSAGTLPIPWVDKDSGPPKCPKSCKQMRLELKNSLNTNKIHFSHFNINNNYDKNNYYYNHYMNNNNLNIMDTKDYELQKHQNEQEKQDKNILQQQQKNISSSSSPSLSSSTYLFNKQEKQYQEVTQKQKRQQQHQNFHEHEKKKQQKQQQKQQCLDYLGDNDESSPAQLCKKSRGEFIKKLRSLRLKHCCERNVLSALHTIALNATLNGGMECIQTLDDLIEIDTLATKITCEYTEILMRYDCRQVYSLLHHCEDCKEAYRRWVCSTLIPYFAEPEDIRQSTTTSNKITKSENHSTTISKGYHSSAASLLSLSSSSSAFSSSASSILLSSSSSLLTEYEELEDTANVVINDQNIRISRSISDSSTETEDIYFYNGYDDDNDIDDDDDNENVIFSDYYKKFENKNGLFNNKTRLISTAIMDPIVKDPIIAKFLKRSKRKVELRHRKRIRPCLSVCQTVEQKCPYLLPGDRAPAYPTQYAGEPTFLCLDPNIPETGEQLHKSNNGPDNCCYWYCGTVIEGICAYCVEPVSDTNQSNYSNETTQNAPISSNSYYPSSKKSQSSQSSSRISSMSANDLSKEYDLQKRIIQIQLDNDIYLYDYNDDVPSVPIAKCQNFQQTTPSSPNRCKILHNPSSSNTISLSALLKRRNYFIIIMWTIFWYLVNNIVMKTIKNWTKIFFL